MDITSRWHDESVMPATRSGTATLRISASWAHRSKLMSPSELACSLLLPLPCLGCATWSWRTGSWILRKAILAGLREDPCLGLRDRRSTDFPRSGNGILAAESAIREYDVTARPSRRKILNHGKHGTTRKGDPNVFPFLCPSRGQLPPVGWGRSVVITYLDNRRAAQRGRTLVEQRCPGSYGALC